jgi:hypothetical protein
MHYRHVRNKIQAWISGTRGVSETCLSRGSRHTRESFRSVVKRPSGATRKFEGRRG